MLRILGTVVLVAVVFSSGCTEKTKTPTGKEQNPPGNTENENPGPPSIPPGEGALTPANTKIEWTGTKPKGKHDGGFKKFSGSIQPLEGDLSGSTITLEIDTESLVSDNPKLTGHLKSPDFFDVKKYPKASFTSTAIKANKAGENTHEITGDLELHGTKKSITFPAKVTQTEDTVTVDTTFTFDRTDHGITYDPKKVDKMVTVKVSAKVSRK